MTQSLPDVILPAYHRFEQALALPQGERRQEQTAQMLLSAAYDLRFWRGLIEQAYGSQKSGHLQTAYVKACLDARQLDRWKVKLETFPAWVRRLPEVRHIDQHVQEVMPLAQKNLHRREAVGLAFARMETLERRTKKQKRLIFAVAGESCLLAERAWRERLEDMLPKGLTYRFAYSYHTLLRGSNLPAQLMWQIVALQPSLYVQEERFWYPRSLNGYDALIWAGDVQACPLKGKPVIGCSQELTESDRRKIMKKYRELKDG